MNGADWQQQQELLYQEFLYIQQDPDYLQWLDNLDVKSERNKGEVPLTSTKFIQAST